MKKIAKKMIMVIAVTSLFFSCGTKQVEEKSFSEESPNVKIEVEEKKAPEDPPKVEIEVEEKKAPEDPPNVKFAKELQKLLKENDRSGAIALFDSIPEELYAQKDMKVLYASLLMSDKQLDKAQEIADFLFEEFPDDTEVLELCSIIALARGDSSRQKTINNQILKTDPYNSAVNIQMADSYASGKKYKQALQYYKKALVKDSTNADALFGAGKMSFYSDDLKSAKNYFEKILENDPENAGALAYLGKLYYDEENFLKAAEYCEAALKQEPYNYDYRLDMGTYYRYLGRYEECLEQWKIAVSIDPDYFLAYAYLAGEYDAEGKFTEALENYRMVIKTNPKYWYAYESTAILEWHEKNWEAARNYFTKAWEISGKKDASYALMIAATYWKQNDKVNMKKFLQQAMKLTTDRESVEFLMLRFYNDNYVKAAETTLKKNIEKLSNTNKKGKMWYYLGLYYELSGTESGAAEWYSKVISLQAPMFFEYRLAEWSLQ